MPLLGTFRRSRDVRGPSRISLKRDTACTSIVHATCFRLTRRCTSRAPPKRITDELSDSGDPLAEVSGGSPGTPRERTARVGIPRDLRRFRPTFRGTVRPARQGVCVLTGVCRSSPAGFASRTGGGGVLLLLHFLLLRLLPWSPPSSKHEEFADRHGDAARRRRRSGTPTRPPLTPSVQEQIVDDGLFLRSRSRGSRTETRLFAVRRASRCCRCEFSGDFQRGEELPSLSFSSRAGRTMTPNESIDSWITRKDIARVRASRTSAQT